MHSLLSGDGGWQVRDADVEEKGARTRRVAKNFDRGEGKQQSSLNI